MVSLTSAHTQNLSTAARHSNEMCVVDSVLLHSEYLALVSYPGLSCHLFPIMKAWSIVLKRNCCTLLRMAGFLRLDLIVALVSFVPFTASTASLVAIMPVFSAQHGLEDLGLFSIIPVSLPGIATLAWRLVC